MYEVYNLQQSGYACCDWLRKLTAVRAWPARSPAAFQVVIRFLNQYYALPHDEQVALASRLRVLSPYMAQLVSDTFRVSELGLQAMSMLMLPDAAPNTEEAQQLRKQKLLQWIAQVQGTRRETDPLVASARCVAAAALGTLPSTLTTRLHKEQSFQAEDIAFMHSITNATAARVQLGCGGRGCHVTRMGLATLSAQELLRSGARILDTSQLGATKYSAAPPRVPKLKQEPGTYAGPSFQHSASSKTPGTGIGSARVQRAQPAGATVQLGPDDGWAAPEVAPMHSKAGKSVSSKRAGSPVPGSPTSAEQHASATGPTSTDNAPGPSDGAIDASWIASLRTWGGAVLISLLAGGVLAVLAVLHSPKVLSNGLSGITLLGATDSKSSPVQARSHRAMSKSSSKGKEKRRSRANSRASKQGSSSRAASDDSGGSPLVPAKFTTAAAEPGFIVPPVASRLSAAPLPTIPASPAQFSPDEIATPLFPVPAGVATPEAEPRTEEAPAATESVASEQEQNDASSASSHHQQSASSSADHGAKSYDEPVTSDSLSSSSVNSEPGLASLACAPDLSEASPAESAQPAVLDTASAPAVSIIHDPRARRASSGMGESKVGFEPAGSGSWREALQQPTMAAPQPMPAPAKVTPVSLDELFGGPAPAATSAAAEPAGSSTVSTRLPGRSSAHRANDSGQLASRGARQREAVADTTRRRGGSNRRQQQQQQQQQQQKEAQQSAPDASSEPKPGKSKGPRNVRKPSLSSVHTSSSAEPGSPQLSQRAIKAAQRAAAMSEVARKPGRKASTSSVLSRKDSVPAPDSSHHSPAVEPVTTAPMTVRPAAAPASPGTSDCDSRQPSASPVSSSVEEDEDWSQAPEFTPKVQPKVAATSQGPSPTAVALPASSAGMPGLSISMPPGSHHAVSPTLQLPLDTSAAPPATAICSPDTAGSPTDHAQQQQQAQQQWQTQWMMSNSDSGVLRMIQGHLYQLKSGERGYGYYIVPPALQRALLMSVASMHTPVPMPMMGMPVSGYSMMPAQTSASSPAASVSSGFAVGQNADSVSSPAAASSPHRSSMLAQTRRTAAVSSTNPDAAQARARAQELLTRRRGQSASK